ncbi:murein transglycosylase A [uncultured Oxalicibacterium sp.]|uniref:murein transglycosylase A n=1 Tax=uncultured Oxalicibacterium sp. TaxID=1168540 RepID=UPI0025D774A3|nr:murein transglycosylase A [uncultured Oxalicibacterium sp.]
MSLIRRSLLASLILSLAACSTIKREPATAPGVETPSEQPVSPGAQKPRDTPVPIDMPRTVISSALQPSSFARLPGWNADNQSEAWNAFITSCSVLTRRPDWRKPCDAAKRVNGKDDAAVRNFFESNFTPYQVNNPDGSQTGMVTGYYEPLLRGSRQRGGVYQTPLHRAPDDLLTIDFTSIYPDLKGQNLRGKLVGKKVVAYPTRAELMRTKALAGREIVWVDDAVEAFFLQVQGSGRVELPHGEVIRLAYADQNGQPYKSIGKYLIDKGELTMDQASMQGIKAWVAANPARLEELLNANPRYIFFSEEKMADPSVGPKGAMGLPLTPQRSIAVDPAFIPLGAPVFLSTTQPGSKALLQRLVMAQDTGSAIKNPVRADFFWGFGAQAGEIAGRMKQRGSMWVLLPK